jgi:hypothetical protein
MLSEDVHHCSHQVERKMSVQVGYYRTGSPKSPISKESTKSSRSRRYSRTPFSIWINKNGGTETPFLSGPRGGEARRSLSICPLVQKCPWKRRQQSLQIL